MSFPKIPQQVHFLYDRQWNSAMDTLCLRTILENTDRTVWMPPNEPIPHAIACARITLNRAYGMELSYNDVQKRVTFFKQRYEKFMEIVNLPHSHWDVEENIVTMHDSQWIKLFKKDGMAKAYFHQGEPEFRLLASIFGHDAIKIENSHTVINISDRTVRVEEPKKLVVDESEDDEVTSPILRRRLFDDRESTNRQLQNVNLPNQNAVPPNNEDAETSFFTAGNSSCASNDPFNWGPFN